MNDTMPALIRRAPGIPRRVASVWFRHFRVYSDTFIANATPADRLIAIGIRNLA